MLRLTAIVLALFLGACGSCGEDPAEENYANNGGDDAGFRPEQDLAGSPCFGCFDEEGTCLSGDDDEACGEGGTTCAPCEEGTACGDDGQCLVPPSCNTDNCDGCCNADDECVEVSSVEACGTGGLACAVCPEGATCADGRCQLGCGPDNCDGCCDATGTCVAGGTDAACGTGGSACTDCAATGELCGGDACVATACSQTCAGCCAGDQCVDAPTAAQCGTGGAACVVCAGSQSCTAGMCQSTANGTWDVILLSADIASTKPNGSGWDSASPLPEVYVEAYAIDPGTGTEWYEVSATLPESLTPVWNAPLLLNVTTEALAEGVDFLLVDQDDFFDDEICLGFATVDASMMNGMIIETICESDPRTKWRWRVEPH